MEGAYAGQLEQHAAELAEHFANSSSEEDLTRALEYSEMAARHAESVYSCGEAARLLEQALRVQQLLDPNDKAKRCDLLLALGKAVIPAGQPMRVPETLAPEALDLADAIEDRARLRSLPHGHEWPAKVQCGGVGRWPGVAAVGGAGRRARRARDK